MTVRVIYHICIQDGNPRCFPIIHEQLSSILHSGLYDVCDSILCFITTNVSEDKVRNFLERYGKKFRIIGIYGLEWKERNTLMEAFRWIQKEDHILYVHSKGITRQEYEGFCVDDWRRVMEYFLIKKFNSCLELLERGADTVGLNFEMYPRPHFSGNFWWVRGDYFLDLPKWIGEKHCDVETNFLFENKPNFVCVHHTKTHHYKQPYPPSLYVDNT
jgi:hypothetical protein